MSAAAVNVHLTGVFDCLSECIRVQWEGQGVSSWNPLWKSTTFYVPIWPFLTYTSKAGSGTFFCESSIFSRMISAQKPTLQKSRVLPVLPVVLVFRPVVGAQLEVNSDLWQTHRRQRCADKQIRIQISPEVNEDSRKRWTTLLNPSACVGQREVCRTCRNPSLTHSQQGLNPFVRVQLECRLCRGGASWGGRPA